MGTLQEQLERIIDFVLSSPSNERAKADALKILGCFHYISQNSGLIRDAIDRKDHRATYPRDRDFKNRVLRDSEGTSFHIGSFTSGEEGWRSLAANIDQFTTIFFQLDDRAKSIFIEKMRYDASVGCLEARISGAMEWATRQLLNPVRSLDDLMEEVARKHRALVSPMNFVRFAQSELKGIECCFDNSEEQPLTPALIEQYARNILNEEPEANPRAASPADAASVSEISELLDALPWVDQEQSEAAFMTLVAKASPGALNQALGLQNAHGNCALLLAAAKQSGPAFMALVSKVSAEALDRALALQNTHGECALSWAAEKQSGPAFMALVSKVSAEALDRALGLQNTHGGCALKWAADKQSGPAFMALVAKVSAEALDRALALQNRHGECALSWAAEKQSGPAFMALVSKVSAEALDRALALQNTHGECALSWAAEKQSEAAFMALVAKVSPKALNQALGLQNAYGGCALKWAAAKQSEAAFMALVAKVSVEALDRALGLQNTHGNCALSWAAEKQSGPAFMALVSKVSAEALDRALALQNTHGECALSWAAEKQSGPAFMALVSKVSAEALDRALDLQNTHWGCALKWAAAKQSEAAFMALVAKVSVEALDRALGLQNTYGNCALSWAAEKQSEAAFMALVAKVSPKALNQALVLQFSDGDCALLLAAQKQSGPAFMALVTKASPEALNQALGLQNVYGNCALSCAAAKQPEAAFMVLVTKASPEALNQALGLQNELEQCALLVAAVKQSEPAFMVLLAKVSAEALNQALALPGGPVNFAKLAKLVKNLSPVALRQLLLKINPPRLSNLNDISAFLSLSASRENRVEILRFLEPLNLAQHPNFELRLRWMQLNQADYCPLSLLSTRISFPELRREASELENLARQNQLLMKCIKPKDWEQFLKMMSDYTYRPALRDPKTKQGTHKFVHPTGQIISRDSERRTPNEDQRACKKTSVTLVNPELSTPVFGVHDAQRPLVGVFLDWDRCITRAMLLRDLGTFARKWVGSEAAVRAYAEQVKNINVTDRADFIAEVNRARNFHNELLVKIPREAVLAIFVASQDPEHMKIALQRQSDWEKQFGVQLSIYYYDFAQQSLVDFQQVNVAVMNRVVGLKQRIMNYEWKPGLLDRRVPNGKVMTRAAYEIIQLCSQFLEQHPNPPALEYAIRLLQKIEALLVKKIQISRAHKEVYEQLAILLCNGR